MKFIGYIKFAVSILFVELMIGRICYEYGYARGGEAYGIGGIYCILAYGVIYLLVCLCHCREEISLGRMIFATVFLGVPYIAVVIRVCLPDVTTEELGFAITAFITLGIALVLEVVTLVLSVKQYRLAKREIN